MICALIMAGGRGTRFWPLSTKNKPKQFLSLTSENSMIRESFDRILEVIPPKRVFVCTSKEYVDQVIEHLPDLPVANIIVEPEGRNTAPCVALSAFIIQKTHPEISQMVVLPSDHLIEDKQEFQTIIKLSEAFLNQSPTSIVTLGITPDHPETGYGYIKKSDQLISMAGYQYCRVDKFVEKPNLELALKYVDSGEYLWNSGMFLWRVDHILSLFKKLLPNTYNALVPILEVETGTIQALVDERYCATDRISIDFGILEKTDNIYVVPSSFGWSDIGNWSSYEKYNEMDDNGNVFTASGNMLDSSGNIVISQKPIVLNNIHNLIIVETDRYILISTKQEEQKIKDAKGDLE